jgi:transketolase
LAIQVTPEDIKRLQEKARAMRRKIVSIIYEAGSGHPGGSLSAIDVILVLYEKFLRHDAKNPNWPDRDRFVLSKGHACPALYTVLADQGYFPEETLHTLRKLGSPLQGHPDRLITPGIEVSTGSLGQGVCVALGIALAGKLDKKDYHVYAMLGDGEIDEGAVWEAAMCAAHHHLGNFTAILDRNEVQQCGKTKEIMNTEPVADKWRAFGWTVLEIDGHDLAQIIDALDLRHRVPGRPTMIVSHTVKGKGVSFMEGDPGFHGKAPNKEQYQQAMQELA